MKYHITKLLTGLVIVSFSLACGGNESVLRSGKQPVGQANAESLRTPFETDLKMVQTGGFSIIYVLRRKDGTPLDGEDKGVIRLHTAQANRRVAADEGKAVIIGSNFQLPEKNMDALNDRFAIENLSPPPSANSNTNSNANQ